MGNRNVGTRRTRTLKCIPLYFHFFLFFTQVNYQSNKFCNLYIAPYSTPAKEKPFDDDPIPFLRDVESWSPVKSGQAVGRNENVELAFAVMVMLQRMCWSI